MEGSRMINLLFRGSQFLWTLLLLALLGNMVSIVSGPSVVNFCLFEAALSAFSLVYLIPATLSDRIAFHWAVPVALDSLNALFSFVAAIALPGYLHVESCDNFDYVITNIVTAGSTQRCREAQASTAFLWFLWVSYMVTAVLTGLIGRNGVVSRPTGPRRGPVMSQV